MLLKVSKLQDGSGSTRYDDGGCETEKQCPLCSFKFYPRARLRGICLNTLVDTFYTVEFDDTTNMPFYQGESGSQIYYDETNLIWVLKNEPDNGIIGNASASLDSMGTGSITWNFNKDVCGKRTHSALMTSCKVIFLSQQFLKHVLYHRKINLHVTMMESV